jgi:hypothetical protein
MEMPLSTAELVTDVLVRYITLFDEAIEKLNL